MAEAKKTIRLSKAAREFNVGITTIVEFLLKKEIQIEAKPNTKISPDIFDILQNEFYSEKTVKEESDKLGSEHQCHETISIDDKKDNDFAEDTFEKEVDELIIKNVAGSYPETIIKKDEKANEEIIEEAEEKPEKKAEEKLPIEKKEEIKTEKEEEKKEEIEKETVEEIPQEKADIKKEEKTVEKKENESIKVVGKIDLNSINSRTRPKKKTKEERKIEAEEKKKSKHITKKKEEKKTVKFSKKTVEQESKKEKPKTTPTETPTVEKEKPEEKQEYIIKARAEKLTGPKILDKIDLTEIEKKSKKPVASSKDKKIREKKKKRKRIKKDTPNKEVIKNKKQTPFSKSKFKKSKKEPKPELTEEEVQKQIKETLARLSKAGKSKGSKHRRQKRETVHQNKEKELQKQEKEKKTIQVTEFVTANELATMMDVAVNEIIQTCMTLGIFASINQRLDAETIALVADEFDHEVEFVSVDVQEAIHKKEEEEDNYKDLKPRAPIVTVMGHVDHGKTLLLDHIRKSNVIAGEAGGITQHIGAYEVTLDNGQKITFLDTPGHEAFTAMRARGAKVTDIVIIIIAADDDVMPQTKEAINHSKAAGVPIVFAINKIDKPNSNPEKIKEQLSKMNILVEDWGGKYQSQEISAKKGTNIDALIEKVLLEAEMLDLKGNPKKHATGTVIESSLDKGRGYVAKILVQNGTIKIGDMVLAGSSFGKVKAMYNERNNNIKSAGPSTPFLLLGLTSAPQAGDTFNVMTDEREAKDIATKRKQLQREQGIRTQKHITLDEIGRRIAIGDFKELNVIVKGDVDGSVEALSDSLIKLSNEEIQVNVIHKSVGAITETDVMLASASDAVIIGFQVRPSIGARKLAETEQIDIRLYSIIYQAIEELQAAIEGMLSPDIEEKIVCNIEIREVYKISKVGKIAGCMVLDGKISRNTNIRIIRDGIVVYTGSLGSLKRFKDDVKEVKSGFECGLNIENYNDIKVGDIVEGFEEIEIKRKL
ncbi:MAG: translation initiation factor IF-2, partial [Bacteroidales bacterium]|nr:translation initiation factor IF-2 [Bacteroidales bacterium]